MALENNFKHVVDSNKKRKSEITELTVLDEKDRSTIYNLIFADAEAKVGEKE